MNIEQLRESLKLKWVKYFYKNRPWLIKMQIWGSYDGQHRPSSGFILATLSILEPQLDQVLPFLMELNNNPDEIIAALGLNFNPEEQLDLINQEDEVEQNQQPEECFVTNILPDKVAHRTLGDRKLYPVPQPVISSKWQQISQRRIAGHGMAVGHYTEYEESMISHQFDTNADSHNKSAPPLTAITQPENTNKPTPMLTVISNTESNSNLVPLFPDQQDQNNTESVSSLVLVSEVENKGQLMKMPQAEFEDKVNSLPAKKVYNIASWLDDFCQGIGWDQEEAIFIPF